MRMPLLRPLAQPGTVTVRTTPVGAYDAVGFCPAGQSLAIAGAPASAIATNAPKRTREAAVVARGRSIVLRRFMVSSLRARIAARSTVCRSPPRKVRKGSVLAPDPKRRARDGRSSTERALRRSLYLRAAAVAVVPWRLKSK